MMLGTRHWIQTGWFLATGLILVLSMVAAWMLVVVERQRPAERRAAELSYLPKGEFLKIAVLGYRQIAADLIWLKAIQHFSGRKQTAENYRWAYHAVDVLTDLDPKFVLAYQTAGTILGVWAGQVRESISILTKGMHHNPNVWQLPFIVGYDYFYELCDSRSASQYFQAASLLPGSPEYLPKLAARMAVESGDPDAALEFLRRLYEQLADQRLREALAQRMNEVIAERDLQFLEEGVRRYKTRYGKMPARLGDLVAQGIIAEIPANPLGGVYELKYPNGTVTSSDLHERLRVHRRVGCEESRSLSQ